MQICYKPTLAHAESKTGITDTSFQAGQNKTITQSIVHFDLLKLW